MEEINGLIEKSTEVGIGLVVNKIENLGLVICDYDSTIIMNSEHLEQTLNADILAGITSTYREDKGKGEEKTVPILDAISKRREYVGEGIRRRENSLNFAIAEGMLTYGTLSVAIRKFFEKAIKKESPYNEFMGIPQVQEIVDEFNRIIVAKTFSKIDEAEATKRMLMVMHKLAVERMIEKRPEFPQAFIDLVKLCEEKKVKFVINTFRRPELLDYEFRRRMEIMESEGKKLDAQFLRTNVVLCGSNGEFLDGIHVGSSKRDASRLDYLRKISGVSKDCVVMSIGDEESDLKNVRDSKGIFVLINGKYEIGAASHQQGVHGFGKFAKYSDTKHIISDTCKIFGVSCKFTDEKKVEEDEFGGIETPSMATQLETKKLPQVIFDFSKAYKHTIVCKDLTALSKRLKTVKENVASKTSKTHVHSALTRVISLIDNSSIAQKIISEYLVKPTTFVAARLDSKVSVSTGIYSSVE